LSDHGARKAIGDSRRPTEVPDEAEGWFTIFSQTTSASQEVRKILSGFAEPDAHGNDLIAEKKEKDGRISTE